MNQQTLCEFPETVNLSTLTCPNGHAFTANLGGMCPHCYGGAKPEPSVELLIPPAMRGSGVWICGKCSQIFHSEFGSGKPHSDFSKKRADGCCTLRLCLGCKKPIVPESKYSFEMWHAECEPPCPIPKPDHPSMTAEAWQLHEYMSELSEQEYCAGWYSGIESILWYAMEAGGSNQFTAREVARLRELSERAGGWCIWSDKEDEYQPARVVSLDEFREAERANGYGI